jgi:hypothetical protein
MIQRCPLHFSASILAAAQFLFLLKHADVQPRCRGAGHATRIPVLLARLPHLDSHVNFPVPSGFAAASCLIADSNLHLLCHFSTHSCMHMDFLLPLLSFFAGFSLSDMFITGTHLDSS